jgi:hypothetical protein
VRPGASSERALILAPTGRDASVAAALIKEAGYHANICSDLATLLHEIETGAGLAVLADEAIKTADLRGLILSIPSPLAFSSSIRASTAGSTTTAAEFCSLSL